MSSATSGHDLPEAGAAPGGEATDVPYREADVPERLAQACMRLVAIPSVTGEEADITQQLVAWAKNLAIGGPSARSGGSTRRPELTPVGHTLILGRPDPVRPTVCLVGHTDTVPPASGHFVPPYREGDRVVGLGASDMKAGLAVMQVLFEQLPWAELPIAPMIIWYDREEGPYAHNGLGPALAACPWLREIDLAVVMEPTDGTLQLGCMGGIQARITFAGRAAHAARPWQGDNAVHKAGPLLAALHQRPAKEVDVHGLTFREALSVTLVQGGRARNVVPDACVLNLNYRFPPTPNAQQEAIDEIHRLARGATVDIFDIAPAGPVPLDNPLVAQLQALGQLLTHPKQAWTDVARLAAAGIDAINFGPGLTAQAHQAGEFASVAAMAQCYDVLYQLFTTALVPKER